MHGLAVYVREGLPFAQDLSLENSGDSYVCFRLVLLHSVSYFFSSMGHPLYLCARFLILFHLIIAIRNGKIVWKHGPNQPFFLYNLSSENY